MTSKRSYLDAANAGRQRRTYASLDQLNRSLESLEQRLGRDHADEAVLPVRPSETAPFQAAQTPRREEDGAAIGKIAGEIKGLREELRSQVANGLQREFDGLRQEFQDISVSGNTAASKLGRDVERLSDVVESLGQKSDDRTINMLRLEIEQMKSALDPLAREETVRSVDRRWDDFDRRFNDFEHRVANPAENSSTAGQIVALNDRIEQIGRAVGKLPESLSLHSLEDKVRTLATALDQFIAHQDGRASQTFEHIEERLDEISRAIVGATVAAQQQASPEPFQRIEARIAALARQIEEVSEDRTDTRMMDQLQALARRVDDLAAQSSTPDEVIDRLAYQISVIADKIDHVPALPNLNEILSGIEQRFDGLSTLFSRQQEDAIEKGHAQFRELELRLNDVARRMDQHQAVAPDGEAIMQAIEQRVSAIARTLDTGRLDNAAEDAIRKLETRLENISRRLDQSISQFAGIDTPRAGTPAPEFVDISPRLREIEKSIAESRDSVLEAARSAAEAAARSLAANQPEASQVAGLAEDLKALDELARLSDARNSKTFEAIHDTLLKIVDRMASLERSGSLPERTLAVRDAPSIEPGDIHVADDETSQHAAPRTTIERTPAEAASAAAQAALDQDAGNERQDDPDRKRSLFGGLTRAFRKQARTAEEIPVAGSSLPEETAEETPTPPLAVAPEVDLDAPLHARLVNTPLEPGSGAPDLNAIMKRVRDERAPAAKNTSEADAGKSDFIAAARRAAQAAAAEADVKRRKSDLGGPVRALRIGDLLKSRRKHLLLGAAALLTAAVALQYGPALVNGTTQEASVSQDAPATAAAVAPAENPPSAEAAVDASSAYMVSPANAASVDEDATFGASGLQDVQAFSPARIPPVGIALDTVTVAAVPPVQPVDSMAAPTVQMAVPAEIGPVALREAAVSGDPLAFFEVGNRFAAGHGVKVDMAEAARWYEKAAEIGFAPAQYRIGNMYEKGVGVAQDLGMARSWYEQAAGSGNATAMHNLAVLKAMGADGRADNDVAAKWFVKAAELGVTDSQFNLGILSAKGAGVPQSLEEAYKWFAIVAETGDKDAATKRDEVAKALRPEQLKRARDAAALWTPKALDSFANVAKIPGEWQDGTKQAVPAAEPRIMVKTVQQVLNRQGYDAGSADGVIGAKTKAAVTQFQADNGMSPTGMIDQDLVARLATSD
jgi:localization factor PodJL